MRTTTIALITLIGLLTAAGSANAQGTVDLTVEARESGCPQAYCFVVTQGSLDDLAPGVEVNVHFINLEDNAAEHEFVVTTSDQADSNHAATSEDDAIAESEEGMAPGTEDNITFTVPDDAPGVYFWCGVPGHEQLGMWLMTEFGGGDTANGAPLPLWVGLIGLVGAVFLRRR
jgi:MYXO-CTERM domain-containing protein